jgi:outer membrane protein TolC
VQASASVPVEAPPAPAPAVHRVESIAAPPPALQSGRGPLPGPDAGPPAPGDRPLPINLATALQLANARPLDVQIAGRQVAIAAAVLDRARLLWVPNLVLGTDYFHHDGLQQNFAGDIVRSSRSSVMAGLGPNVVFSFSDAVYAPLAARQDVRARQSYQQAVMNDVALQVAETYFAVQQARGELAGARVAEQQAEELVRRAAGLVRGLAPPTEETRAKVELARRRQYAISARERWRTASAELARLLRLDPAATIEPMEPPFLPVTVIDPVFAVDDLIPIALSTRPELAGQQAVVQATLARLKQEKIRPLVPSLAVRSASTNPSGSLGYGAFGGGQGGNLRDFAERFDVDVQLLWEFQSLGFGNKSRVNERRAEHEAATLDLFRTQDRIAAEVATAFAQAKAAAERVNEAEPALRGAIDLVNKNVEGLGQTRRAGDLLVLVVRPQEAVAAVQALAAATADFYAAVGDYNRAQFRLYRALGHPSQCLAGAVGQSTGYAVGPPTASPEPPARLAVTPAGSQVSPPPADGIPGLKEPTGTRTANPKRPPEVPAVFPSSADPPAPQPASSLWPRRPYAPAGPAPTAPAPPPNPPPRAPLKLPEIAPLHPPVVIPERGP